MAYFVIQTSADGEVSLSHMSREELEAALAAGELDPKEMKTMPGLDLYDDDLSATEGWYLIQGEPVALTLRKARVEREIFQLP